MEIKRLAFLLIDLLNYACVVTDLSGCCICEAVCSISRLFQPFVELWVKHRDTFHSSAWFWVIR